MAEKKRRRPVKCKVTGERGYSDEYYKAPDNSGYYKTKEIYDQALIEKQAYKEVKHIIDIDFLGYEPNLPYNSLTPYNLKQLKGYSNVVILETVKRNYDMIMKAISNKNFKDTGSKCTYIFAIIKSHALNVKRDMERQAKQRKAIEAKAMQTTMTDKFVTEALNNEQEPQQSKSNKDISSFLSEEELL